MYTSKERSKKSLAARLPGVFEKDIQSKADEVYEYTAEDRHYDKEQFKAAFLGKLQTMHGRRLEQATDFEKYLALAGLIRDFITESWIYTKDRYRQNGVKQVYYFSIEFLIGRLLGSYLLNMGLQDLCNEALGELGIDLAALQHLEEDPGLGNGGLGRLAACYLDSMASENLPGHGCGIRYKYGLFEQQIFDGYQHEYPDDWLKNGYPWEFRRPDEAVEVKFGGNVRMQVNGKTQYIHENYEPVLAMPYDIPVVGYGNRTVNTLRLWNAQLPANEATCSAFNRNDCTRAVSYMHEVEAISEVLYPDDSRYEGKVLRLKQQYFLVSAGLQSIIREYKKSARQFKDLPDRIAVHINDTHPALAIPELMRILIDEEGLGWSEAWKITHETMSYTNHTVLPEALERWTVDLFKTLLPRIFMIVNEINEQFCHELWSKYPGQWDKIRSMAIIADGYINMAHLAIAGSHSVNGVAKIHTQILKEQVMRNFYQYQPAKFNNKTNGVTHRRWLISANPALAELITDTIGPGWIEYPCNLINLLSYSRDAAFQESLLRVKLQNKVTLAKYIKDYYGLTVDANSIFDAHIKRIHAYKRQALNVFNIMNLYNRLKEDPDLDIVPRTFIFAGKAAASYYKAKKTIKLINALADVVNNDKSIRDKIKVIFLENYNVSLAELIIPATDVSEQIPTASREACGTGNMKLMMNGAVTVGTLDGANIEIKNAVGDENIITFGLTAAQVLDYYQKGGYNPRDIYNSDPRVKKVMEQLVNGFFSTGREEFRVHYDAFLNCGDYYFHLKDFAPYIEAQNKANDLFKDRSTWLKMSAHNIGHSGKFSGDRTFTEYAMDIWQIEPDMPVRCYCQADEAFAHSLKGCARTADIRSTPIQ